MAGDRVATIGLRRFADVSGVAALHTRGVARRLRVLWNSLQKL